MGLPKPNSALINLLPKPHAALPDSLLNLLSRPSQPAHLDHEGLVFRITQDPNDAVVLMLGRPNVVVPPEDKVLMMSSGHVP
jgi:hypothetical protein